MLVIICFTIILHIRKKFNSVMSGVDRSQCQFLNNFCRTYVQFVYFSRLRGIRKTLKSRTDVIGRKSEHWIESRCFLMRNKPKAFSFGCFCCVRMNYN